MAVMAMTVEVIVTVFMALSAVLLRGRRLVAMLMGVAQGVKAPGSGSGSGGMGNGGHRFHFTRVSRDAQRNPSVSRKYDN